MSSQAIELQKPQELVEWRTPSQVKMRVQAIQKLMAEVLKPDIDFGKIPGLPKDAPPSLFKPGSEQILSMFQIAVEPIVEDLSDADCFRYRVVARMTHAPTGQFLGAGIGECSSNETKYKWRKVWSSKEFESYPEDRRRTKFGRYKKNDKWIDTEELQVRQEPADLANTILKMAKKRAQIDGTLTVTAASSMFQQDLEDLPQEVAESFSDGAPIEEYETIKPTTAKPKAPPQGVPPTQGAESAKAPHSGAMVINEKQLKRLCTVQGLVGMGDVVLKNHLTTKYGITSRKNITVDIYDEVIAYIDPDKTVTANQEW